MCVVFLTLLGKHGGLESDASLTLADVDILTKSCGYGAIDAQKQLCVKCRVRAKHRSLSELHESAEWEPGAAF